MAFQRGREFYVFPLGRYDWDPQKVWQGPLSHKNIKKRNHTLYKEALSVEFEDFQMPRTLAIPDINCLCKRICLMCSVMKCEKHPRGSGLRISCNGTEVELDVSNGELLSNISEEAKRAISSSKCDKESYIDVDTSCQVRLLPSEIDHKLCLFCARPLLMKDAHKDCPDVRLERNCGSHFLSFASARDASRWRSESASRRRICPAPQIGEAVELTVRYISPYPTWNNEKICSCCGRQGATSPLTISNDRCVMVFGDDAHKERWVASHGGIPAGAKWKRKKKCIHLTLSSPMVWQGHFRVCPCCGDTIPSSIHSPVKPPLDIAHLVADSAEAHFESDEHADAWLHMHPRVRVLKGPLCSRTWSFGVAQLLPLMNTLIDFKDQGVEAMLFSSRYIARCLVDCTAREASHTARQAHLIDCAALRVRRKHRIYIRPTHYFQMRTRVDAMSRAENASILDDLGRICSTTHVATGEIIAKYEVGDKFTEIRVREPGLFSLEWLRGHPEEFMDIAELTEVFCTLEHLSTKERSAALEQRARDAQSAQSRLAMLLRDETLGSAAPVDSLMQTMKRLETGKKIWRADEGTTRAQAETSAHIFHPGATTPIVCVSEVVASGLSVLRQYEGSREDHLAMITQKKYPKIWQVLCSSDTGKRKLQAVPSEIPPLPIESRLSYCHTPHLLTYARVLCEELPFSDYAREAVGSCVQSSLGATASEVHLMDLDELLLAPMLDVSLLLQLFEKRARDTNHDDLARRIGLAMHDEAYCLEEIKNCRIEHWCRHGEVTHVVGHPINMDRYYAVRNPVDNAGSVQCVTLKVIKGTECGSNFSAMLLVRYGMDYDGDHAVFVAVLDLLSVKIQESLFGPDNKLFTESGALSVAPTYWPLERWCAILVGTHLRLDESDALRILSGAGITAPLQPPLDFREKARYAAGTRLRFADTILNPLLASSRNVLAEVESGNSGEYGVASRMTSASRDLVWILEAPNGTWQIDPRDFRRIKDDATFVCDENINRAILTWYVKKDGLSIIDPASVSRAEKEDWNLAWVDDSERRIIGNLSTSPCADEMLPQHLRITTNTTTQKGVVYCRGADVWRADISGQEILASLWTSSLRRGIPLFVGAEKRMIWNGGSQLHGGLRCSFRVPACAGRGWETLVLQVILLHRIALSKWMRAFQKHAMKDAPREVLLAIGIYSWRQIAKRENPLQSVGTERRPGFFRYVKWAFLVLRLRYAETSANSPTPKDFIDVISTVALYETGREALEVATKLQTTGYLICPTLHGRSHPPCGASTQRTLELCKDLLNFAWEVQPPLPFPRSVDGGAQLRRRGLVEPCRRFFGKMASGLRIRNRCGRCEGCSEQDESNLRLTPSPMQARSISQVLPNAHDLPANYTTLVSEMSVDGALLRRVVLSQALRSIDDEALRARKKDLDAILRNYERDLDAPLTEDIVEFCSRPGRLWLLKTNTPSTRCGTQMLTAAGIAPWASLVAHRRLSAMRTCGFSSRAKIPRAYYPLGGLHASDGQETLLIFYRYALPSL